MNNIHDEFQEFKTELKKLNIEVQNIKKIGNGSMDFYEVFYKSHRYKEVKSVYVQRHSLDSILEKFRLAYR
ncbi:hypothetical protein [uncultured Chryseobacterium sp.]|uniref:hypothetical protein n=1 Tax=uncultured Chryseobacterium sp. TaxID=259322 RepID=UPI00374A6F76